MNNTSLAQNAQIVNDQPAVAHEDVTEVVTAAEELLNDWLKQHNAPSSIVAIAQQLTTLHSYETLVREIGRVPPFYNVVIDGAMRETAIAIAQHPAREAAG